MQTSNRVLDDVARIAGGAVSAMAALKQEVDALVRQRVERLAEDLELVTREEFDAVRATASRARAEQERLEARVAFLERRLAELAGDAPADETGPNAT